MINSNYVYIQGSRVLFSYAQQLQCSQSMKFLGSKLLQQCNILYIEHIYIYIYIYIYCVSVSACVSFQNDNLPVYQNTHYEKGKVRIQCYYASFMYSLYSSTSHQGHAWPLMFFICVILLLFSMPSCYGSTVIIIDPPIAGLGIYRAEVDPLLTLSGLSEPQLCD